MYKTAEQTLFIGKNIVFVPECTSTNDLALKLLQQTLVAEGAVVITDHQTAGRGQRGNRWQTLQGLNLTFSLILKPGFLPIRDQFMLNVVTSLAVFDYLKNKTRETIHIKWPNDILVKEKKICGILIENQLQGNTLSSSVVGVGLNILQEIFLIGTATSLAKITGETYDLPTELNELLSTLEVRYLQLRQLKLNLLINDYLSVFYRIHQLHPFQSNNEVFEGTIIGIDEIGKLKVDTKEGIRSFGLKEITFL